MTVTLSAHDMIGVVDRAAIWANLEPAEVDELRAVVEPGLRFRVGLYDSSYGDCPVTRAFGKPGLDEDRASISAAACAIDREISYLALIGSPEGISGTFVEVV